MQTWTSLLFAHRQRIQILIILCLFKYVQFDPANIPTIQALDEVVSLGKLGRNLYRKSILQRGWVNTVIDKPRDYFVVENVTPGTPVFDKSGIWIGITAFRKESGKPSGVITVPAKM